MAEVLRAVGEEFAAQLRLRGTEWSIGEDMPAIKADRLSMVRVIRNLVDNALKYGGGELSRISIRYEDGGRFHIFSVSDDGVGIREEDCEKIFGLFQRNTASRSIEGSGLGLAIVKDIAEQHGGRAWAAPGAERGDGRPPVFERARPTGRRTAGERALSPPSPPDPCRTYTPSHIANTSGRSIRPHRAQPGP
jgi:signal transduction histidine kinase